MGMSAVLTCIEMAAGASGIVSLVAATAAAHPADFIGKALAGDSQIPTGPTGRPFLVAFDMAATTGAACAQRVRSAGTSGPGAHDDCSCEKGSSFQQKVKRRREIRYEVQRIRRSGVAVGISCRFGEWSTVCYHYFHEHGTIF